MSKNRKMQRSNQVEAIAPVQVETAVAEAVVETPTAEAEAPKAEPKIKKPTIAGIMDEVLTHGGTWAEMVNEATEKAASLKIAAKFSKGLLTGHLKYRANVQKKAFAKALVLSEEGITTKQ